MKTARLRSWEQYIRKHWIVAIIIALVIAAMVLIFVESLINGTGFNGYNQVTTAHTISGPSAGTVVRTEVSQPGKTLWDLLQLLLIPLALAIIAILFNRSERKNEQRIASDNQQDAALQAYINEMSELLLEKHLRESKEGDEVRTIARVRTLTILPRLNEDRKSSVLQFLFESGLIDKDKRIINLSGANLSRADLRIANVTIWGVSQIGAILSRADLSGANLSHVDFSEVSLTEANLKGAIGVTVKELEEQARSLKGATMPNGSKPKYA